VCLPFIPPVTEVNTARISRWTHTCLVVKDVRVCGILNGKGCACVCVRVHVCGCVCACGILNGKSGIRERVWSGEPRKVLPLWITYQTFRRIERCPGWSLSNGGRAPTLKGTYVSVWHPWPHEKPSYLCAPGGIEPESLRLAWVIMQLTWIPAAAPSPSNYQCVVNVHHGFCMHSFDHYVVVVVIIIIIIFINMTHEWTSINNMEWLQTGPTTITY